MNRPQNTWSHGSKWNQDLPGMPATEQTNDYMIKRKQTHIVKYGNRMIMPRIIPNSIAFDPENRFKFDVEVASQLALVAAERPVPAPAIQVEATEVFPMGDNSGAMGQML
jgi:hypothetical protein